MVVGQLNNVQRARIPDGWSLMFTIEEADPKAKSEGKEKLQ